MSFFFAQDRLAGPPNGGYTTHANISSANAIGDTEGGEFVDQLLQVADKWTSLRASLCTAVTAQS
jgi:hypothetical protein